MNKELPQIIIFSCNWNGWSCIESATSSGLSFPASVKLIRVTCLSRVHAGLMLKAYELGADGVMLLGCEPGKCNFCNGANVIANESEKAQHILELLGIGGERLVLLQLPPFEGQRFIDKITKMVSKLARKQRALQIPIREESGRNVANSLLDG